MSAVVFINTAVVGKVSAPLYRSADGFSTFIYIRNPKSKDLLVDKFSGTRADCNKFRNAAVKDPNLQE